MKILDPVLVPDVSLWCNRINAKEFEDGGCQSVIIGLYPETVNGKQVLNPVCRAQCQEVAKTSMVLQAYYWDDITLDPLAQANWVVDTIQAEGLPIKFVWADDEQWWLDWTRWNLARNGKMAMASVPCATPAKISSHMQAFAQGLHTRFPASGIYTNNGFVASYAPGMNTWMPAFRQWVPEYFHEPKVVTQMTWAALKANWMPNFDIALAAGQLPGQVAGLQFTGDVIKLPGAYDQYGNMQTLDVSVFSRAFINELRGIAPIPGPAPVPVPAPVTNAYKVVKTSWIFPTPNDVTPGKLLGQTYAGEAVTVAATSGDWAQLSTPIKGWVRLVTLKAL
jgi:hypothetical protein